MCYVRYIPYSTSLAIHVWTPISSKVRYYACDVVIAALVKALAHLSPIITSSVIIAGWLDYSGCSTASSLIFALCLFNASKSAIVLDKSCA